MLACGPVILPGTSAIPGFFPVPRARGPKPALGSGQVHMLLAISAGAICLACGRIFTGALAIRSSAASICAGWPSSQLRLSTDAIDAFMGLLPGIGSLLRPTDEASWPATPLL